MKVQRFPSAPSTRRRKQKRSKLWRCHLPFASPSLTEGKEKSGHLYNSYAISFLALRFPSGLENEDGEQCRHENSSAPSTQRREQRRSKLEQCHLPFATPSFAPGEREKVDTYTVALLMLLCPRCFSDYPCSQIAVALPSRFSCPAFTTSPVFAHSSSSSSSSGRSSCASSSASSC